MSDRIEDGGPAFPSGAMSIGDGDSVAYATGMTLRDWFAGQALKSLIRNRGTHVHFSDEAVQKCRLQVAEMAYGFADAMLAARKGGAQ